MVEAKERLRKDLEKLVFVRYPRLIIMNGKKGSFEINIPAIAKGKTMPETGKKSGEETGFQYLKDGIWSVWVFCKEDTNRVVFALKVGLAVLLVSLLILFRAPYEVFGESIIWSILTVAIMFEFTVGMYTSAIIQVPVPLNFLFLSDYFSFYETRSFLLQYITLI